MEKNSYRSNVVKVVSYLLDHKGEWIIEPDFEKISPQYYERIINEMIVNNVVTATKDGICYDFDNFESLKKYVNRLGIIID